MFRTNNRDQNDLFLVFEVVWEETMYLILISFAMEF